MKPHPIPQMKHPRQRIRLLPTRSQPRLQLIVLILLHQRIEDLPTHPLRLRIRPHPQIQIIRTTLNNHHHRPRLFHPAPTPDHQHKHPTSHQRRPQIAGAPSFARSRRDRVGVVAKRTAFRRAIRKTHPWLTFPNTTALFAPVAAGTFPGNPFQLNHASSANATASFACAGTPNSSIIRTFTSNGSNPSRSIPINTSFFAPPPATTNSTGDNGAACPNMPPNKSPIRIHHRSRRQRRSRSHHILIPVLLPTRLPAHRNKPRNKRLPKLLPPAGLRRQGREVPLLQNLLHHILQHTAPTAPPPRP